MGAGLATWALGAGLAAGAFGALEAGALGAGLAAGALGALTATVCFAGACGSDWLRPGISGVITFSRSSANLRWLASSCSAR